MSNEGIYEPAGRAGEFAQLALSIWKGCPNGCNYCFMSTRPRSAYKGPAAMQGAVAPRDGVVSRVTKQAPTYSGDPRRVLIQFSGDAYPPAEADACLTREVLRILRDNDVAFDILTKCGALALRDLDLIQGTRSRFAQTVVWASDTPRAANEPAASTIAERYYSFAIARARGVETWCSLEPIIDTAQALAVLKKFGPVVGAWKIGRIMDDPREKDVDWKAFGPRLADALTGMDGVRYYIKESLRPFMPHGFPLDTLEEAR